MFLALGILLAITAMLSWGTSDFFAKVSIDSLGHKTSLLLNHLVAFVPIIILATIFFKPPHFQSS